MNPVRVAILGSTGSIGTQTLEVIRSLQDAFSVVALAAGSNLTLLESQIREFRPKIVAARTQERSITGVPALPSPEGLIELATHPEVDLVVTATSGHDAIAATWAAIAAGKQVAIANKETIVCAGDIIMPHARAHGVELRPVDSEHSAVWQALMTGERRDLARIILTASGGPFRHASPEELASVTVDGALAHPNWAMGRKITIDSATMMNKGLEVIEAHHLFDASYDQIDVVIHPEQIIHSFVEWNDRSTIANMSFPDMRLPIQYALTHPRRVVGPSRAIDFTEASSLTFDQVRSGQYPAFELALEAGRLGQTYPTALSASDEIAVAAFLDGRIAFTGIAQVVGRVLERHQALAVTSLEVVAAADHDARRLAREAVLDHMSH